VFDSTILGKILRGRGAEEARSEFDLVGLKDTDIYEYEETTNESKNINPNQGIPK